MPLSFAYKPDDYESEKASNSYLMSVVAVIAGLPLPVINLIATVAFFFGNRKGTYFVRWHCMNVVGVYWSVAIFFGSHHITNNYIAYIITIIVFNLAEFIATLYAAIRTRKGAHVVWWFFGPLTDLLVKA
jgi:lipopolysaccharide export LptBFGC system permease protein LptF